MALPQRLPFAVSLLFSAALLTACGGGGSEGSSGTAPAGATPVPAPAPAPAPSPAPTPSPTPAPGTTPAPGNDALAPTLTGNAATDGFNWFNYRRQQIGLRPLARNTTLDTAAFNHSTYQKLNDTITHNEDPAKPGYTGATESARVAYAGYTFSGSWALGEVISATTDGSGVNAAESLITAIYHRFLIFEPLFREAGAGTATVNGGYMYFTVDFAASPIDYSRGLAAGTVVTYPFAGQTGVPVNFFSDYESPDPVPNKNEVGYPISVHANINGTVSATSFTVAPRGGAALPTVTVQGETHSGGSGPSALAIIPLDRLAARTTYDVSFAGTVNGIAVTRSWSFTTR